MTKEGSGTGFSHSGGFVLRTPLLPWRDLEALTDGSRAAEADLEIVDDGELEQRAAQDGAMLFERLREIVADPVVAEALFLASPNLSERVPRWERGEDDDAEATTLSILRYVSRMATRPTPFGLFAGCAYGTVGERFSLDVADRDGLRRHTRLDFGFLAGVVSTVEADPQNHRALTFFPNSSLYSAGGRLRMTERRVDRGRVRYHRVTFEPDDALLATIARAASGATVEELAEALVDEDVTAEDAGDYVAELIASQVLVSDLGPMITGPEPVPEIVRRLSRHASTAGVADVLARAHGAIARLDARGPGVADDDYREIADELAKVEPDLELGRLFQVDLSKPGTEPTIPDDVVAEIGRAVELLHGMTEASDPEDLARFRTAFSVRYDQREIPLLEALDEEIGVGFGTPPSAAAEGRPLLAGLPLARTGGDTGQTMRGSDHYRLRLLLDALVSGAETVDLSDEDVAALAPNRTNPLPDAFAVNATVVASGADAVAAGDFQVVVHSVAGPSGARMLGRFCHTDAGIDALVRAHLRDEEQLRPGAVFAEIVHLPEGRLGNVIARPVLRDHELPFLGQSGAPREHLLSMDDLMVSVRGGRIVLRSRRLGVPVVPRLTNAHNFRLNAVAPYHFLAALQYEGVAGITGWSWGPMGSLPFLPRVTAGRVVVARAQWNLTPRDLVDAKAAKAPGALFRAVQRVRAARRLPRWVVVASGDNELALDLGSVAGCALLAREAGRAATLLVKEILPGGEGSVAEGAAGRFAHELLLPLVRVRPPDAPVTRRPPATSVESITEVFPPGSEWLSARLSTGKATADALLLELVDPLIRRWRADGLAHGWFFIRYGDPDWHLRVRIRGDATRLGGEVMPQLRAAAAPFLTDGRLGRIELHPYEREVPRYGGPAAIALVERLFEADSDATLSILRATRSDDGLVARWRLALVGTDRWFSDISTPVEERQRLVRLWRDALVEEHGDTGVSARRFAGKMLRTERTVLEPLLAGATTDPQLTAALRAFELRSKAVAPIFHELRELEAAERLVVSREDIVRSIIHMQDNRILRGAQRLQELVLYDLLDRLYSAAMGRARAGK